MLDGEQLDLAIEGLAADYKMTSSLGLESGFTGLVWLEDPDDVAATTARPEHNSRFTAFTRGFGRALDDRLITSLGAAFVSKRTYNVRAGIPPIVMSQEVPNHVRLEAVASFQPDPSRPLWVWLRGQVATAAEADVPLPQAAELGSLAMIGLEWR